MTIHEANHGYKTEDSLHTPSTLYSGNTKDCEAGILSVDSKEGPNQPSIFSRLWHPLGSLFQVRGQRTVREPAEVNGDPWDITTRQRNWSSCVHNMMMLTLCSGGVTTGI